MTKWFDFAHFFRRGAEAGPVPGDWSGPAEESGEEEMRQISPLAAPVHVLAGPARISIDNGVLRVEREGEAAFERPVELVAAVHIHGPASITSPCVAELVRQGTQVIWRGVTGYPIGCAQPLHQAGLDARRAQYEAAGNTRGLAIARVLVAAKIVNMRGLVRRRAELAGRGSLDLLQHQAKLARRACDLDALRGIEGAATAQYFAAWPAMLSERAGELTLATRTRRPPQDAVNALLSYAYAVLAGECLCAAVAAGLDARQGFLHRPRAGRPALALDLMEPFRPLIADQAVLSGLNNGRFNPEHFREEGKAVLMNDEGRRLALDLIERRLAGEVTLKGRGEPVSWRAAIGLSARALADALRRGTSFSAMERA